MISKYLLIINSSGIKELPMLSIFHSNKKERTKKDGNIKMNK